LDKLHIGTMGWSYDFWTGDFYPKGMTATEFLGEYSKRFDTVEVDRTFYGVPYESTVLRWKAQTPANFLFSLKVPKAITHEKMLKNCDDDVKRFTERISLLQDKLGPLLLQFPYAFKPEHLPLLSDFLPTLPKKHRFVVEVRNKKLLDDSLLSLLRDNGVAFAIVDQPFMPRLYETTADFTYIRWEGDRRKVKGTLGEVEIDRKNDIVAWVDRIRRFLDNSIEVFGYFSKYYTGYPPSDGEQLLRFF
jgi:uncharacterized protein YecE (DUF72 family)